MRNTKLEREAEQLWLRLRNAQAEAWCNGEFSRRQRLEQISELAFWRLIRRMAVRHHQEICPRCDRRPARRYGLCAPCRRAWVKWLHRHP